jgi:predicted kinase
LLAPALANFAAVRACAEDCGTRERLSALEAWTHAEHARRLADFSTRTRDGRIRECHGDLHLGNIAWIDGRPALFDCIEFDERLRWIDVMSEIGFAVMDLHARGRADLGQRLLNRYLEASGDYAGLAVLAYYLVYRALVRAKVDCIRARQPDVPAQTRSHHARDFAARLALAEAFARPRRAFLAITCGLSGSGKTHASQQVIERTRAIRIRSDIERKRLHGLEPCEASGSAMGTGIYTAQANDCTFERLAALCRIVIEAGYPVIIDAAFIRRERRATFRSLAATLGVPFVIVNCRADDDALAARIRQRQAESRDASEATLEVLAEQKRLAQPLDTVEDEVAVRVDTSDPDSMAAMLARIDALCRCD